MCLVVEKKNIKIVFLQEWKKYVLSVLTYISKRQYRKDLKSRLDESGE